MSKLLTNVITLFISLYQHCIAPLIAPCCRFSPSCSQHMKQAIIKYGIIKGSLIGIKQLLQCHPWKKIK